MVEARLLHDEERIAGMRQQDAALGLARRLPSLVVAAKEVASSVMHGVHGRRQAGSGETFWQFRPFVAGESITRVDWRRSARDDRYYVREREWESAHTVWLWMDRSPSMAFISALALQSKLDRALVLGLAAADLLVRGGERAGLLGLTRPLATRAIIERFAEVFYTQERKGGGESAELPPAGALAPRTRAVLISDFLSPPADWEACLADLAARGARGHLVMIADPVEETFPFAGHTEFLDVDSGHVMRIGQAERFRDDYIRRLEAHRAAIAGIARAKGWSLAIHRTDRPASEALLALRMQLEAGDDAFPAGVA
ncbi:MAG: DUF58 domain-containing protein [Beijerinckiaceae bacterium]